MITTISMAFFIWHIIPLVTLFICALLIFTIKGNQYPVNILGYTFLASGIALGILLLINFPSTSDRIDLFEPDHVLGAILLIPLFFFYLIELMHPGYLNLKKIAILFGPIIILVIIRLFFFKSSLPAILNYKMFVTSIGHPEMIIRILMILFLFAMPFTLSIRSYRLYVNYKKDIYANFSEDKGKHLKWVPVAILLAECYSIALVISVTSTSHWPKNLTSFFLTFTPLFMTCIALRQQNLFESDIECNNFQHTQETNGKMIGFDQLKRQLIDLLEKRDIYKDTELTAEKVCNMLGTNRTYLSRLIKNEFQTNFYGLINSYRLEAALSYIKNKEYIHIPIKDIAGMAGFKSVSTFNKLFKEKYKLTPVEWRNRE